MKKTVIAFGLGVLVAPIALFFGKLAIFAAGLVAVGAFFNIFAQEMRKLEGKDG